VADLAAQGGLFGGGLTDNARALLQAMFREPGYKRPAGRQPLADRLSAFVDEAMKSQPGANLFGEAPPTARDVLAATDRQGRLAMMSGDATASQEAAAKPEATQALVQEARRVAATIDPDVPMPDGTMRKASDLLTEAEDDLKRLKEVEGCALGMAAE
jgi:hypothetical protein